MGGGGGCRKEIGREDGCVDSVETKGVQSEQFKSSTIGCVGMDGWLFEGAQEEFSDGLDISKVLGALFFCFLSARRRACPYIRVIF